MDNKKKLVEADANIVYHILGTHHQPIDILFISCQNLIPSLLPLLDIAYV